MVSVTGFVVVTNPVTETIDSVALPEVEQGIFRHANPRAR